MSVTRDQAAQIATLARLRFDDDELEQLTGELNHILAHVEILKTLEAAGGEADVVPHEGSPTRGNGAETADRLEARPSAWSAQWQDGFFVVPPLPGTRTGGGA